jgi:O-antigen ligase
MRERRSAAREKSGRSRYWLLAATLLGAGIVLIPILYTGGAMDAFRLPKEMAFRAEAIALALTGVFAATAKRASWRDALAALPRREWYLLGAIAVWSIVTTLTSTNRPLSEESLVTLAAAIVIYVATRLVAPGLRLPMLFVIFAGALANAVVVTLQELHIWNPFVFPPEIQGHVQSVGLVGNPNDVGTLLAGPAVVALAAAAALRGWKQRLFFGSAAMALFLGIAMSRTRTAMIAFVAGAIVVALLRPWRQALAVAAVLLIVAAVALRPSTGIGSNFQQLGPALRERNYPILFSERLVPFLSAIEMIRSRPVTGVGPGAFKYHFMLTRLALEQRYPVAWTKGWPMNFGETHNDHLQVTAETGFPGYVLFLAGIALLAIPARRRGDPSAPRTAEQTAAHAIRTPLAATFFVIAIAQFPLQIAAPRLMFLTLGALAISWDRYDE